MVEEAVILEENLHNSGPYSIFENALVTSHATDKSMSEMYKFRTEMRSTPPISKNNILGNAFTA